MLALSLRRPHYMLCPSDRHVTVDTRARVVAGMSGYACFTEWTVARARVVAGIINNNNQHPLA